MLISEIEQLKSQNKQLQSNNDKLLESIGKAISFLHLSKAVPGHSIDYTNQALYKLHRVRKEIENKVLYG